MRWRKPTKRFPYAHAHAHDIASKRLNITGLATGAGGGAGSAESLAGIALTGVLAAWIRLS